MSLRFFFLVVATVGVLAAQDPPSRVGRLNYIDGSVSFQPAGVNDWVQASLNRPLTIGDQIYADDGARAEIHTPGTVFRLGSRTAFEFLNLDDRNVQAKLSEGTLTIRVRRIGAENIEVDTPNAAFTIVRPGEYRIDANPDTSETYLTVRSGEGEVTGNGESFPVHPREQAVVTGQDQTQYDVYQAPGYDDFDNWAESRDRREDRGQSSRYVSPNVVGYEDLDDYGTWRSVPEYGQVWMPRDVASDWAPYHNGHWAWVDPWGWTWVDDAPWGFAPFHYGRWAYFEGNWGWVPGPVQVAPVYAPALVAWVGFGGSGVSFSFGEAGVGWFPLGPRDVYIPSYAASETYVTRINTTNTVINNTTVTNVYNNYQRTGSITNSESVNRTAPNAMVAMPQSALASARPVQQVAVRVQPNQAAAVKTVESAPHVAPQQSAALGRMATSNAPHPAASVISKPVVAKATPPPPAVPFQQRQALLAQNPGRPLTVQQQQQIRQAAPVPAAARPAVRVITQAKPITPQVSQQPAPRTAAGGFAPRPGNAPAPPRTPNSNTPEGQRGTSPQSAPQRPAETPQTNRPFESPRQQPQQLNQPPIQERRVEPAQPSQPNEAPRRPQPPPQQEQQNQRSPERQVAPPPQQERPQPPPQRQVSPTQPERQNEPTPQRPSQPPQPERRYEPPPQRQAPPPQTERRTEPPPVGQERRAEPPPQRQEARPPTPPPQERRAEPPPQDRRPPSEKRPKEEKPPKEEPPPL